MRHLIIFSLIIQLAYAAPAFHGKRTFIQPDGTEVTYRLQGDEHLHWMESEAGEIMLFDTKGDRLEYAEIKNGTLQPSGIPVLQKSSAMTRSASAGTVTPLSKETVIELQKERRDRHLSKMKKRRHSLHQ